MLLSLVSVTMYVHVDVLCDLRLDITCVTSFLVRE